MIGRESSLPLIRGLADHALVGADWPEVSVGAGRIAIGVLGYSSLWMVWRLRQ